MEASIVLPNSSVSNQRQRKMTASSDQRRASETVSRLTGSALGEGRVEENASGYTSLMVDDNDSCASCGGTGWTLVEVDGVEVARRCGCAEETRRARLLEKAAIPARYRHCTLSSFEIWNPNDPTLKKTRRAVQEWVDLYPAVDKGLLLMGPVGTGKTHLAVAAMQELIRNKGVRGRFADFTSLVLEMQMTFDGSGSSRQLLAPLLEAEVLVLDELGAGKATPWVMDLLYYLVNSRYLEGRLTIFTTNFSDFPKAAGEESLADRVSARIRSRLFEMCQRLELYGADYRRERCARPGRGSK